MTVSQIPLITRALARNRVISTILLLQVVVAVAVVTNLAFLLSERLTTLTYDTGLEEAGLGVIETELLGASANNPAAAIRADVETLRQLPGVSGVVAAESLPLSQRNWTAGFTNKPINGHDITGVVEAEPTVYSVSAPAIALLGLKLTAGRDFSPSAFVPMAAADDYSGLYKVGEVVISEALAKRLFPQGRAVGRAIYADARHPLQVVGVVSTLSRPVLRTDGDNDMSLILPLVPDGTRVMYALRSEGDRIEAVVSAGDAALTKRDPVRMVTRSTTFSHLRADYFRHDQTMAMMFFCAGLALLLVTATGVYGLASFWVRGRYQQIGIRRALGARRVDILRYFLVENLILTVAGSLIGSLLAVGLNLAISRYYEVARIEAIYLVTGVVAVLLIGQIAVLVPAYRAAREVPITMLRNP